MPIVITDDEAFHLKKILHYYEVFKKLTLHFEEKYGKSFPPAILGIRDTLDHMMRSLNMKFRADSERSDDYIIGNLVAAENHIYRAIFELLDILATMGRNRIVKVVDGYSNETLNVNVPIYYHEVRPFLLEMEVKVETYRSKKDSSNIRMDDVEEYLNEIRVLEGYASEIESVVPQMEAYEKTSRVALDAQIKDIKKDLTTSKNINYILGAITVASFIVAIYTLFC